MEPVQETVQNIGISGLLEFANHVMLPVTLAKDQMQIIVLPVMMTYLFLWENVLTIAQLAISKMEILVQNATKAALIAPLDQLKMTVLLVQPQKSLKMNKQLENV